MTRLETGRKLLGRAIAEVADFAPREIADWGPAWDIVEIPAAELTNAINAWADSGTSEDRARLGAASGAFTQSWREAVAQFVDHLATSEHDLVTIVTGDSGTADVTIPAEDTTRVRLDPGRVAAIQEDTSAVALRLADVFAGQEDDHRHVHAQRADGGLGLDEQHTTLLTRLVAQPTWTPHALDQAARECGLLGSGAVEVINELALARCGEPLFESRDPIEINDYAREAMEV